jgi:hypothetical protein
MKFDVFTIITVIGLSFIPLAGCVEATSYGSVGRAPDSPTLTRVPLPEQECIRVPFPQCSGGGM